MDISLLYKDTSHRDPVDGLVIQSTDSQATY